jgi:hypothetical protein
MQRSHQIQRPHQPQNNLQTTMFLREDELNDATENPC